MMLTLQKFRNIYSANPKVASTEGAELSQKLDIC